MKNFCPTHHFSYEGRRCPYCEKDRIANMQRRLIKTQPEEDPEPDTNMERDLDWSDLAGVFTVTQSKK